MSQQDQSPPGSRAPAAAEAEAAATQVAGVAAPTGRPMAAPVGGSMTSASMQSRLNAPGLLARQGSWLSAARATVQPSDEAVVSRPTLVGGGVEALRRSIPTLPGGAVPAAESGASAFARGGPPGASSNLLTTRLSEPPPITYAAVAPELSALQAANALGNHAAEAALLARASMQSSVGSAVGFTSASLFSLPVQEAWMSPQAPQGVLANAAVNSVSAAAQGLYATGPAESPSTYAVQGFAATGRAMPAGVGPLGVAVDVGQVPSAAGSAQNQGCLAGCSCDGCRGATRASGAQLPVGESGLGPIESPQLGMAVTGGQGCYSDPFPVAVRRIDPRAARFGLTWGSGRAAGGPALPAEGRMEGRRRWKGDFMAAVSTSLVRCIAAIVCASCSSSGDRTSADGNCIDESSTVGFALPRDEQSPKAQEPFCNISLSGMACKNASVSYRMDDSVGSPGCHMTSASAYIHDEGMCTADVQFADNRHFFATFHARPIAGCHMVVVDPAFFAVAPP
jgi:hypothetical protein